MFYASIENVHTLQRNNSKVFFFHVLLSDLALMFVNKRVSLVVSEA